MTIYRVQGPDGRVHKFEGPAGASPAEVEAAAAAQFGGEATQQPQAAPQQQARQQPMATQQAIRQQAQMNPVGRFAMGVARPVLETAYGVQELAGRELTPEQEHQLEVLRGNKGFAGGAGRFAGELATFAAPGGLGTKLAAKAPAGFGAAARVGADVAASAGMEALRSPTDDRSRADAAKEGAFGAVAGRAVGAVAGPFVRGVRNVTDDAKAFMQQHPDVVPTVGQLKGGWARNMEERAKALPFIGNQIAKREKEALEAWNSSLNQKASPFGFPTGKEPGAVPVGHSQIGTVQRDFGNAYDDLFKGQRFDLSQAKRAFGLYERQAASLPSDAADRAAKRLTAIRGRMGQNTSGEATSRIDDELREYSRTAGQTGFPDEARLYDAARESFKRRLPIRDQLEELDKQYRQWIPVERAASYKGAAGGVYTPSQLLGGSRASTDTVRKRAFGAGNAPQQSEAELASRVLGNELPVPGPGTAEKLLGPAALLMAPKIAIPAAAGLIPYSRVGQKAMAGKYPWQGKMKSLAEILAEKGVTAGTVGAAIEE